MTKKKDTATPAEAYKFILNAKSRYIIDAEYVKKFSKHKGQSDLDNVVCADFIAEKLLKSIEVELKEGLRQLLDYLDGPSNRLPPLERKEGLTSEHSNFDGEIIIQAEELFAVETSTKETD